VQSTVLSLKSFFSLRWMASVLCLGSLVASLGLMACADPAQAPPTSTVVVFLHNGTDKTGELIGFNGNQLSLKTATGIEKIERLRYQGLVLDTPTERKIAERMTQDPLAYIAAGMYVSELRTNIRKAIVEPKDTCKPTNFPWAHFQVSKAGKIQQYQLLVSSGCPALDTALSQAIQTTQAKPLPADLPFEAYPINFYYEPPGFVYTPPKGMKKSAPDAQPPEQPAGAPKS
jgi:hypothetical protein